MKHGTFSMYVNKRCRCADCRKANAQYIRNYRIRKAHGMPIRRKVRRVAA